MGQKNRVGASLPLFGQCSKENIFFREVFPLSQSHSHGRKNGRQGWHWSRECDKYQPWFLLTFVQASRLLDNYKVLREATDLMIWEGLQPGQSSRDLSLILDKYLSYICYYSPTTFRQQLLLIFVKTHWVLICDFQVPKTTLQNLKSTTSQRWQWWRSDMDKTHRWE